MRQATSVSTHSPPLSILATYLQAETDADFVFLGIQPRNRGVGAPLSEQVSRALVLVEEGLAKVLGAQRKMD
jgi:Ni,Fe-hydrogenase maturation factor